MKIAKFFKRLPRELVARILIISALSEDDCCASVRFILEFIKDPHLFYYICAFYPDKINLFTLSHFYDNLDVCMRLLRMYPLKNEFNESAGILLVNAVAVNKFSLINLIFKKKPDVSCEYAFEQIGKNGNVMMLKFILKRTKEPISRSNCIITACKYGNASIVSFLLSNGLFLVNQFNDLLNEACTSGHYDVVQILISTMIFKERPAFHPNILENAIRMGNRKIVESLLNTNKFNPSHVWRGYYEYVIDNGHIGTLKVVFNDPRMKNPKLLNKLISYTEKSKCAKKDKIIRILNDCLSQC